MSETDKSIRLQKFLADQGVCSRRQAEAFISEGLVFVDGKVAQIGQKVTPGVEKVVVNGRGVSIKKPKPLTLMLHKPKGYICSNADPYNEKTVFDLVPHPYNRERLFCAGRLDKDSDGMLIITNDGDLTQKITHPSNQVIKKYRVVLSRPIDERHIKKMIEGFEVDGDYLKAEKIFQLKKADRPDRTIEVHLEHGKKREIRRMAEHLGYYVNKLTRFQMGSLMMKGVGPGKIKLLNSKEIKLLFK